MLPKPDPKADLITKRLPAQYKEFTDIFSKNASDKLPLY